MSTLAEFFAMGGYAVYVWSSYALAAVVLIWNAVQPLRRERRLLQTLAGRTRRRQPS
ncbi:MAG TPA: heme exporter protein CcmD [Gammaproteobacteria bacterium]|nr:heme exporter protein CcmD [Gammaproteobacteria bacterium]